MDSAAVHRPRLLGVAVELPEPYAVALADARRASGDPAADHMAPHITLVPPVLVTAADEEVDEVLRAAAARIARFDVHLRGTGTFRPVSEVVFVAVAAGIGSLEQLSAELRVRPLDPPRRFPYHPHVTVAMDVPTAALDEAYGRLSDFEARFEVASFRLYEHQAHEPADEGRRWHAVRDFPLTGGGGG